MVGSEEVRKRRPRERGRGMLGVLRSVCQFSRLRLVGRLGVVRKGLYIVFGFGVIEDDLKLKIFGSLGSLGQGDRY